MWKVFNKQNMIGITLLCGLPMSEIWYAPWVEDTPTLLFLSLLLMCAFNPVVLGYSGGLMDDRAGIPHCFEVIILILRTAFFYNCNTQHQRCSGLESEDTYAHCCYSLKCLVYALQMSFCISFHWDVRILSFLTT